ncbi:hypothetical protein [Paraburkholderia sp.]|uniref:hypothetical protein n=1 Tax=Paraburkholderia sp. TaxID=1926495 RepID=UPI0025D4B9E7|nr:hypothetical protein [Paraburkholderia sp.]
MDRIIQITPDVVFAADVLRPEWAGEFQSGRAVAQTGHRVPEAAHEVTVAGFDSDNEVRITDSGQMTLL